MKVINVLAAVVFSCLPSFAFSQDQAQQSKNITGAFGLNLGSTLEPKGDGMLSMSGYKTTQFSGKESSGLFSMFFAAVTPQTKKVAAIVAMSEGSSDDAKCESSAAQLARALTKQYGPRVEHVISVEAFRRGDLYVWKNGDVEVQLACRSYGIMEPFYVQIFYTDNKLMEDFKSESYAMEQGEINLSDFGGAESGEEDVTPNSEQADAVADSNGGTAEGPLGFTWGAPVASAPVKYESQIDLTREQHIFDEAKQYNCQREVIGGMSATAFGASYSSLLKTDDHAKMSQYYLNEEGADVSIGGRVSAYLFRVKFAEKPVTACGAYFDDKLFMLQFYYDDLAEKDLYDTFKAALNKQYGEEESSCFLVDNDTHTYLTGDYVPTHNSFKMGSLSPRNMYVYQGSGNPNFHLASDKTFLSGDKGVFGKVVDVLDWIADYTPLPKLRLTNSIKSMEIQLGYQDEYGVRRGPQSSVYGISLKDNPDKARGIRGPLVHYEELGMFANSEEAWNVNRKAVEDGDVAFGYMLGSGTANVDAADFEGLRKMFYSPRAFNIYPVKNVYDKSTADLMIGFYSNLLSGQSKREALVNAQKTIRNKGYSDPKCIAENLKSNDSTPVAPSLSHLC